MGSKMRWSYKTVHFSLKKDGLLGSSFLDEDEIEITLNEYGRSGWELVSFMEVTDGVIAVFKQPFGYGLPNLDEESKEKELPVREEIMEKPAAMDITEEKTGFISPEQEELVEEESEKNNDKNDDRDVGSIRID
ncbi:MAG TPA: DUF4177 domain-containing protein [Desulfocapsa sulfexigens]|nr:DUF4177 domain-containing protein [Desulfocapsa sulfexigens]